MHGLRATSHSQVRNEPFGCTENIEHAFTRMERSEEPDLRSAKLWPRLAQTIRFGRPPCASRFVVAPEWLSTDSCRHFPCGLPPVTANMPLRDVDLRALCERTVLSTFQLSNQSTCNWAEACFPRLAVIWNSPMGTQRKLPWAHRTQARKRPHGRRFCGT